MMILALGHDWLACGGGDVKGFGSGVLARSLSGLSPYSSLRHSCTVTWHPEQIGIGVASFEGDARHATVLLERKLRAQGEISSDVKILILESQQVGRGYQVLYVTVTLDEWQKMLSWAGSQHQICRLTFAAALAFKRVQGERAVVLQAGRQFHFFARHDGQLVHLQAISVDDNVADLAGVSAMLGTQVKDEMQERGCDKFDVTWVPAAFKGARRELETVASAFADAVRAGVVIESESLGATDAASPEVHSGLLTLARHIRPKDLLNQGEDKLHVLAHEYLPYGAVIAAVASLGLAWVGYGWMQDASALTMQAHQLQTEEASVRESISVIARDAALEQSTVTRQVDFLHKLSKVRNDFDPVHLLNALKLGSQDGIRILAVSTVRPTTAGESRKSTDTPAAVVDGALPESAINSDQDTRSLSRFVRTLHEHGYRAEPVDIRAAAAGESISTRLFSYRVTRIETPERGGS